MQMNAQLLLCSIGCFALACSSGSLASAATAGIGPSFKGPVGLQLYSLRDQFGKDVPGTLDEVKKMGFRYAEVAGTYGLTPDQFKAQLAARGIEPIGAHFSYEDTAMILRRSRSRPRRWASSIPAAPGFRTRGILTKRRAAQAAAVFNRAGEVLAKHGLKFFYHCHGYEFQPFGQGTLFDLLMAETNPKFVRYEMDIFWVVFPNQDPVKLFERYGKRWELVHLKDMKKGTPTGALTGGTDVKNDAALGAGQMDLPAILRAAKKAGVKWYFIEDESPWSEQQIPQSLRFLEQVKF